MTSTTDAVRIDTSPGEAEYADLHIRKWLIVQSGFLQHLGSKGSGCCSLFAKLRQRYDAHDCRVELHAWNDNPDHLAEYIHRFAHPAFPPDIRCFSYSWGAGYGFVRLAESLGRKGLTVNYAVLCDPVYHGWMIWRSMLSWSLTGRVRIKLPGNVRDVFWLRQFEDKPQGHDLVGSSKYTHIREPLILKVGHTQADNSFEFHAMAIEVADRCPRCRRSCCSCPQGDQ